MIINWIATITLALAASTPATVSDGEALQVMTRLQALMRSDSNIASYTMRVDTPDWQRTMRFESWDDQLGKRVFIRIASPKKVKDTAYLKLEGNLWMYLPNLGRKIRIPPSMMLSSWMGSGFTYDDLIKVTSVVDDFTHRIIARDQGGMTIESTPKPDTPIVWGKLVHVFNSDGLPVSEDFYDEDGRRRRNLQFEDVREMGGRQMPTRWVMRVLDDAGSKTVLQLESVQFDSKIANSVFTHANMRRSGR